MGIILCETLLSFKLILYQAEKKKIAWLVCFLFFCKACGVLYSTVPYIVPLFLLCHTGKFPMPL